VASVSASRVTIQWSLAVFAFGFICNLLRGSVFLSAASVSGDSRQNLAELRLRANSARKSGASVSLVFVLEERALRSNRGQGQRQHSDYPVKLCRLQVEVHCSGSLVLGPSSGTSFSEPSRRNLAGNLNIEKAAQPTGRFCPGTWCACYACLPFSISRCNSSNSGTSSPRSSAVRTCAYRL